MLSFGVRPLSDRPRPTCVPHPAGYDGSMSRREQVRSLLDEHGTTYAEAAGIALRDKPAPLYQLLVLSTLSATRISADVAAEAARELFAAGFRTPQRMRDATWQQRVDALGRGGYRRYDESTSTQLERAAAYLFDTHGGDLRRLRSDDGEVTELRDRLVDFPRLGPTGAGIFCREVQDVWTEVRPFFDERATRAAGRLGLPTEPDELAELAPQGQVTRLAAALVRADLATKHRRRKT
jgi:hypothetical protein